MIVVTQVNYILLVFSKCIRSQSKNKKDVKREGKGKGEGEEGKEKEGEEGRYGGEEGRESKGIAIGVPAKGKKTHYWICDVAASAILD